MATQRSYNASNFSAALQTPQLQKSQIDPLKAGLKTGAKAMSATSSLATTVPWGTIASGAISVGAGIWGGLAAKKKKEKQEKKFQQTYKRETTLHNERMDNLSRAKDASNNAGYYSNLYAKDGGQLPVGVDLMKKFIDEYDFSKPVSKHREGGKLNVIPNGALHSRKNNYGDKGVPVVVESGNDYEKAAEIEREELILSKDISQVLEDAIGKYQENPDNEALLLEIGTMLKDELLNNTDDKTNKLLTDGK